MGYFWNFRKKESPEVHSLLLARSIRSRLQKLLLLEEYEIDSAYKVPGFLREEQEIAVRAYNKGVRDCIKVLELTDYKKK